MAIKNTRTQHPDNYVDWPQAPPTARNTKNSLRALAAPHSLREALERKGVESLLPKSQREPECASKVAQPVLVAAKPNK